MSEEGFTLKDLEKAKNRFEEQGKVCLLINLGDLLPEGTSSDPAYLLVVRDYLEKGNAHALHQEQSKLTWDSKALMYGRVERCYLS